MNPSASMAGCPQAGSGQLTYAADLAKSTKIRSLNTAWMIALIAGCILGLIILLGVYGSKPFSTAEVQDFTGFWIGGKLLGTPYLYDVPSNLHLQKELTGGILEGVIYVRPPFFAALLKPFTSLPYTGCLVVWKCLMLTCLFGFVWCFPLAPRRYAALAMCWSIPALLAILRSNDSPVVLFLIALSLGFWCKGRKYLSGVALGLCLAKFHFLFFLPLLLLHSRYRRVLAGFLSVLVAALFVCFLVQPDWVRLYWKALNLPQQNMNARATMMPNLYASFFWTGHPALAVTVGGVLIGILLWRICQQLPFEWAMPSCILGALLAAPHTNHLDGILAMPMLLAMVQGTLHKRVLAILLVSPLGAWLYCVGPPIWGPTVFVGLCSFLLIDISCRCPSKTHV